MIIFITFLVIFTALIIISAFRIYKARRSQKVSWIATIVLILSLAGLLILGSFGYGLLRLFFYVPMQGKIVDVLPDTSWIDDNRDVLYLDEGKLCSIKINGQNKSIIYDNVIYYALSPDKRMVAIEYGNKPSSKEDRNTGNIAIIYLASGEVESIEKKTDCGYPLWLPDSSKIFYDYDDSYHIRLYDVISKTKQTIDEPKMVCSDMVAAKDGNRIFYRSLFDEKCYEVDVKTLARREILPYGTTTNRPYLYNYIHESDVYIGIQSGGEIREWRIESPDRKRYAYNKEGSLWLNSGDKDIILVSYIGAYDSKFAPGVWPMSWSEDGKYLVCDFKGKIYICDTGKNKTGYLTKGDSARIIDSDN